MKELTENPMVEYMDIRNWGRNKAEVSPMATEASISNIPGKDRVYVERTIHPIVTILANP